MLLGLFWTGVLIVAGEYVLYHVVLFLVRGRALPVPPSEDWPHITVLIPTYNEAATIADKLANVRAADYPVDRLHIVVGDDASNDGTVRIVEELGYDNVRVHSCEERRGKIHVQREILGALDTPIVVLTDATVRMEPDALKLLVRHFADPIVGGVSARIRVANTARTWLVELHRLLVQLQNGQKAGECRLDSAGGLYGQLCAIRLSALGGAPDDVVYEDREFGIRLRERGFRVRLEDDAEVAYLVPETVRDFRAQKARIAGAMTESVARHWRLLFNPAFGGYGLVVFPEYALFRVVRQPLLLAAGACLVLSVPFGGMPFSRSLLHAASAAAILLISFWGGSLCLLPYLRDRRGFVRRLATGLPGMALLAGILVLGSVRFLRRGQSAAWKRIQRDSSDASDAHQPQA